MRIAVHDLGSNSFHLLVADVDEHGRTVTPVLHVREMLHLGRVVAKHGMIPDAARAHARTVVADLADHARRSGAVLHRAVATSALRDAANGVEVAAELSAVAGMPVEMLDEHTEARLAYLGARARVAVAVEPTTVLDLGGGSLEIAVGTGDTISWSTSLRLGASRLSATYDRERLSTADLAAIGQHVDVALDDGLVGLDRIDLDVARGTTLAVGGTVRALARILIARGSRTAPTTTNGVEVVRADLTRLRDRLVDADLAARLGVPGMSKRRADHLHLAAIVLVATLERLGVERLLVSDGGLREGVLLDRRVPASR